MGEANAGRDAALAAAATCAGYGTRIAVLVEGMSDRAAVITLANRLGRDLGAAGVVVIPMGGATNIGHFAAALGPSGLGIGLAGLCDAQEEDDFRRGMLRAGLAPGPGRGGLERTGFYVCVADLEDEMIRALGTDEVERVIAAEGESRRLRTFLKQPAQRGRPRDALLRRFIGTHSGAKARYGAALAGALDLARLPPPLKGLLADCVSPTTQ